MSFNRPEEDWELPGWEPPKEPGCSVCGSKLMEIRGKHPGDEPRKVCATCLQERMDTIHDMSRHDYGIAYTANAPVVGRERSERTHQQEVRQ